MDAATTAKTPETPLAARPDGRKAGRTGSGDLKSFSIRRRITGEQAAARALLMRRLRVALPLLAFVLVAAFFLNTRKADDADAFLNDFADIDAVPENLTTAKPHFSGIDARGNPYDITAATATQQPDGGKIVELDQPRAVTSSSDDRSVVSARSGVFDPDSKRLVLKNGVTFERELGPDNYVLKTTEAAVSIDDQTVTSDKGVAGEGPGGSVLTADLLNADNRDGKVVFEGNVRMRIYPKKSAEDAPVQDGENE